MMKEILRNELDKAETDIPRLIDIIVNGKPLYKFGFVFWGYDRVGLFEPYEGGNIFHELAQKGILSMVLPVIFDNKNLSNILTREDKAFSELKQFLNAVDNEGLTPAHLAVTDDLNALQTLYECGVSLRRSDYLIATKQYKASEYSPLEYIFVGNSEEISERLDNIAKNSKDFLEFLASEMNCIIEKINSASDNDKKEIFSLILNKGSALGLADDNIAKIKQLQEPHSTTLEAPTQYIKLNNMPVKFYGCGFPFNHLLASSPKFPAAPNKVGLPFWNNLTLPQAQLNKDQPDSENKKPEPTSSNSELIIEPCLEETTEKMSLSEALSKYLAKNEQYTSHIQNELGENHSELHSFIVMLAYGKDWFEKLLQGAVKKYSVEAVDTEEFWVDYIKKLKLDQLILKNSKRGVDAYGLSCALDEEWLAKLLLNKGLKLGFYTKNTKSLFDQPIKSDSNQILKYLLTEQQDIELDWHYILSKAIKYANVQVITYYVESEATLIETTTDRKGNINEGEKYTLLNKALDDLVELSAIQRYKKAEQKEKALKKIPKLCKCIKLLLTKDDKLYCTTAGKVLKKTFDLLQELSTSINNFKENNLSSQAEIVSDLKSNILTHYKKMTSLSEIVIQKIEDLENNIKNDETLSSASTDMTKISALSDIGGAASEYWQKCDDMKLGGVITQCGEDNYCIEHQASN